MKSKPGLSKIQLAGAVALGVGLVIGIAAQDWAMMSGSATAAIVGASAILFRRRKRAPEDTERP